MHAPKQSKGTKRNRWRLKNVRKMKIKFVQASRRENMGVTHQQELMREGRKIARWLIKRAASAGYPTSQTEMNSRIKAICSQFDPQDQAAIGSAALATFKRDDPEGYAKFAGQGQDVIDTKTALENGDCR